MSIEEIPADELVEMTELWHRSFNAAGCNPMCHCCCKMIPIGEYFKLATITKAAAFYPVDIRLKLKERGGDEITDKDLWEAHDVWMRYNDSYRWSKDNKIINRRHTNERVTYDEYISNTDRPSGALTEKTVFFQSDIDKWEEIKSKFRDTSHEVMLCDICTPEEYTKRESEVLESKLTEWNKPKRGGCFRINGKIVH